MTGFELIAAGGALVGFLVTNGINVWGTWEQRRQRIELQESNRIARMESGRLRMGNTIASAENIRSEPSWISRSFYLPIFVSGIFMLLTWVAVGINVYYRNPPEIASTTLSVSPSPIISSLQVIPSVMPSPSLQASNESRSFTDATPNYLLQIYNNHTDIQASRLVQPYMGKWMKVEGIVEQVAPEPYGGGIYAVIAYDKDAFLGLRFKANWHDRVFSLVKGDRIAVVGRLENVQPMGLTLSECEFQLSRNGK
jgi:hypothetical protein